MKTVYIHVILIKLFIINCKLAHIQTTLSVVVWKRDCILLMHVPSKRPSLCKSPLPHFLMILCGSRVLCIQMTSYKHPPLFLARELQALVGTYSGTAIHVVSRQPCPHARFPAFSAATVSSHSRRKSWETWGRGLPLIFLYLWTSPSSPHPHPPSPYPPLFTRRVETRILQLCADSQQGVTNQDIIGSMPSVTAERRLNALQRLLSQVWSGGTVKGVLSI